MIKNSNQNLQVGANVNVGFMPLVVLAAVKTPGDYLPDAYILGSTKNSKLYKFVPHNGIEKLDATDIETAINDIKKGY